MEDEGVLSHQTFLVKNFPFLYRRENKTIAGVLSSEFWLPITDLKQQLTLVKKNDNVQHYFEDKFNFWNDW